MASRSPLSTSRDSIRDVAADAHYLSSNCVVYVYYSDVRAVIEEHFSKALGSQQQTNFSGDNKTKGELKRFWEKRKKFECFTLLLRDQNMPFILFELNCSLHDKFSVAFMICQSLPHHLNSSHAALVLSCSLEEGEGNGERKESDLPS